MHTALAALTASLVLATAIAFGTTQEADGAAPRPTLATIDWLSGHWRVSGERGSTEELWTPARGGLALGLNRSVRVGKDGSEQASFEFLRIEERDGGLVYVAQPSGSSPTEFALTEADARHVVFMNPEHDFPQRIEYRLDDSEPAKLIVSAKTGARGPTWTLERVGDIR